MLWLGVDPGVRLSPADCRRQVLARSLWADYWWALPDAYVDRMRPKTRIGSRCPLSPEAAEALREALANRPKPKDEADDGLALLTARETRRQAGVNPPLDISKFTPGGIEAAIRSIP
jgi:hypothetical protein